MIVLEFLSSGDLRSWLKDRIEESVLAYMQTVQLLYGCVSSVQMNPMVCVCMRTCVCVGAHVCCLLLVHPLDGGPCSQFWQW